MARFALTVQAFDLMCTPLCFFDLQDGDTALHFAAGEGHEKVVRALLEGDAKVDLVAKVSHAAKLGVDFALLH